jgi:hypothetical protein
MRNEDTDARYLTQSPRTRFYCRLHGRDTHSSCRNRQVVMEAARAREPALLPPPATVASIGHYGRRCMLSIPFDADVFFWWESTTMGGTGSRRLVTVHHPACGSYNQTSSPSPSPSSPQERACLYFYASSKTLSNLKIRGDVRKLALLQLGLPENRMRVGEAVLGEALLLDMVQVYRAAGVCILHASGRLVRATGEEGGGRGRCERTL